MARTMAATDKVVYRACVEYTRKDGTTYTTYQGPYGSIGAARGQATVLAERIWYGYESARSWVETATFDWSPVP
jgi:hypothetical protein